MGHLGGWQQLCPGGVEEQEALRWGQYHLGKPLPCQPALPQPSCAVGPEGAQPCLARGSGSALLVLRPMASAPVPPMPREQ